MAIILDNRGEIRRFVQKETAASAAVNGILTAGATWITFSDQHHVPVWSIDGLAFDLLPSTFIPVLLMGVMLPMAIGARLRSGSERGGVPLIDRRDLRRHLRFWGRVAPRSMIVRALLLAFVLAFLFVPIGLAALWVSGLTAAPLTHVLVGKAVWGVVVGAIAAPLVILPAATR